MAWYDIFKASNKTEVIEGYQSFSTPFQKVGGANLSLPYVNGRFTTANYIPFGEGNLYPELLNQMYYSSPLHGAICDYKTNAVIGGGFELITNNLTPQQKLDLYTFERKTKLDKMVKATTRQLVIHNRVYFKLCFNEKRELVKIKNLSPEKIRVGRDKKTYFICDDWASRIYVR